MYKLSTQAGYYTCVLVTTNRNLLFAGTTQGVVEIWDLDIQKLLGTVQYLLVDQFGDTLPLNEPVVHLSSPAGHDFVYAFMGNAAYCIDINLLAIIQQIPISERVVSGSVFASTGEIAVITEPGYISLWSPKFIERIASVELNYRIPRCYMTHDVLENRIIILSENDKLLLINLKDEKYISTYSFVHGKELLSSIFYDKNINFQVVIKDGVIQVFNADEEGLPETHILHGGRLAADDKLRHFILATEKGEEDREYIKDLRLDRSSIDRYAAELETVKEVTHVTTTVEDDSQTLIYALQNYLSGNLETRTEADLVITKISNRNDVDKKYVLHVYKKGSKDSGLISTAIQSQRNAELSIQRLQFIIPICLFVGLLAAIIADRVTVPSAAFYFLILLIVLLSALLVWWQTLVFGDRLPGVKPYVGLFYFVIIELLVSITFIMVEFLD